MLKSRRQDFKLILCSPITAKYLWLKNSTLQEDKLRNHRSSPHRPTNLPSPSTHHTHPNPRPKPLYVQRTPDEMALHREKGLCYNCDEKWSPTHCCKGRVLLLIANTPTPKQIDPNPELSPSLVPKTTLELESLADSNPPHISLHALSGLPSLRPFASSVLSAINASLSSLIAAAPTTSSNRESPSSSTFSPNLLPLFTC